MNQLLQKKEKKIKNKTIYHKKIPNINPMLPLNTETLLTDLFKSNNHLGYDRNKTNSNCYPYIYGVRSNQCIIDLTITTQMLLRTLKFIQLAYHYKKTAIHTLPRTKRKKLNKIGIICNTFHSRQLGESLHKSRLINNFKIITQKWVTGGLTANKQKIKYDFLIVFDISINSIVINEAAQTNVPVIALIDTDQNPSNFTYPIITNTKNIQSVVHLIQIFDQFLQNLI